MKKMPRSYVCLIVIFLITSLFTGCTISNTDKMSNLPASEILESSSPSPSQLPQTDIPTETPSAAPQESSIDFNIKVNADKVNIRKDKSTNSEIMGIADLDSVYPVINEGLDANGKTWYMIEFDFGINGWIAGWLCEKTNQQANVCIKSEEGNILPADIENELYVDALTLEDYTIKSIEDAFGKDYTTSTKGLNTVYSYPSGLNFNINTESEVNYFGFGDESNDIRTGSIVRKVADINGDKADELVILFENNFTNHILICDKRTQNVLREYDSNYSEVNRFEIGDFLNNKSLQIYLYGYGNEYDENGDRIAKKGIYQVAGNEFAQVLGTNSFNQYNDIVKPRIDGMDFSVTVQLNDYDQTIQSAIPKKVFSDTADVADKSSLLSINNDWFVINKDDKWYVTVRETVKYPMIYYYWGPPDIDVENNSVMYNDLARVDILLAFDNGQGSVAEITPRVKYDKPELLEIQPITIEEGRLIDGPVLESSMEEAYKALGGNMDDYEYSDSMELNGVRLFEFCSSIVDITVTSPSYQTTRGLKVGDSIERVESLYGKPDSGFSGDDYVMYKCGYESGVSYYRGLDICYIDNVVASFTLYQVILD